MRTSMWPAFCRICGTARVTEPSSQTSSSTDSSGSFLVTDPNFNDPAYGVLNGSVGFRMDQMEFSLYAKNLANDQTIIQRPVINSVSEGYTLRPITFGVTAKRTF